MEHGATSTTIASVFGLAAFVVAIVAGLGAGNRPASVLGTALGAMVVCQVLGLFVGLAGERLVAEHTGATAPRGGDDGPPRTSENPQVIHNG